MRGVPAFERRRRRRPVARVDLFKRSPTLVHICGSVAGSFIRVGSNEESNRHNVFSRGSGLKMPSKNLKAHTFWHQKPSTSSSPRLMNLSVRAALARRTFGVSLFGAVTLLTAGGREEMRGGRREEGSAQNSPFNRLCSHLHPFSFVVCQGNMVQLPRNSCIVSEIHNF